MRITDLRREDTPQVRQAATLLVEGLREHWPDAWPDLASARREVRQSLQPGRISRVALDDDGNVLGWIGGISSYDGNVWELHPLVVQPAHQGAGIGRALVGDLEAQARARGGVTLWVGTDDEDGSTSLAGVDLYPNVLDHLAGIRNLRRHPYGFYQRLGFSLAGILPDANGPGKPDIFLAKRLSGLR